MVDYPVSAELRSMLSRKNGRAEQSSLPRKVGHGELAVLFESGRVVGDSCSDLTVKHPEITNTMGAPTPVARVSADPLVDRCGSRAAVFRAVCSVLPDIAGPEIDNTIVGLPPVDMVDQSDRPFAEMKCPSESMRKEMLLSVSDADVALVMGPTSDATLLPVHMTARRGGSTFGLPADNASKRVVLKNGSQLFNGDHSANSMIGMSVMKEANDLLDLGGDESHSPTGVDEPRSKRLPRLRIIRALPFLAVITGGREHD